LTTGGVNNTGPAPEQPQGEGAARIPDELVDAFLDRELDSERSRDLLDHMKNDPARSEEIARSQRMLSLLRRAPLHAERAEEERISAIMARVHRRRSFLPESWRRLVTAGRLSVAATFLLAGFAFAVLGKIHPDAFRLASEPAPLASLVSNGRAEAALSAFGCVEAIEGLSEQAAAPFRQLHAEVVVAEARGPDGAIDLLHPGALRTVRLTQHDEQLVVVRGAGGTDLELTTCRQRSGASAPVFVPTMRTSESAHAVEIRASRGAQATSAVFTSFPGPFACQNVTVGDHTVVVPATISAPRWQSGPFSDRRLLLIQATPSDLFLPR
jgi:hypothetical protein